MAKQRKPRPWSRRIKVVWNDEGPTNTITYTIFFGPTKEITLSSDEAADLLWQLGRQYLGDTRGEIDEETLIEFFAEERHTQGTSGDNEATDE